MCWVCVSVCAHVEELDSAVQADVDRPGGPGLVAALVTAFHAAGSWLVEEGTSLTAAPETSSGELTQRAGAYAWLLA